MSKLTLEQVRDLLRRLDATRSMWWPRDPFEATQQLVPLKDMADALDGCAKDAERYRWLRDADQDMVEVYFATDANASGWGDWNSCGDKDKRIDTAMLAAAKGEGNG